MWRKSQLCGRTRSKTFMRSKWSETRKKTARCLRILPQSHRFSQFVHSCETEFVGNGKNFHANFLIAKQKKKKKSPWRGESIKKWLARYSSRKCEESKNFSNLSGKWAEREGKKLKKLAKRKIFAFNWKLLYIIIAEKFSFFTNEVKSGVKSSSEKVFCSFQAVFSFKKLPPPRG
jgi:hypothetical protein